MSLGEKKKSHALLIQKKKGLCMMRASTVSHVESLRLSKIILAR